MNAIKEFVVYPFVVLNWTRAAWWSWVCKHLGWSVPLGVVVFAVSAALHQQLISRWPELEKLLGDPMGEIASFIVYGLLGLGCVSAATLLGLLLVAPSQIYHEQKNKIASLMPPPLNLTLAVGNSGVSANQIDLIDLTLTNCSQKNMDLTFSIRIKGGKQVVGAWHIAARKSSQDGQPRARIDSESTVAGTLVFKTQDNLANESLDDCVLEIRDAISLAAVFCKPKQGFPSGKVASLT